MPTPIHATNAWNPTGRNLLPVDGTRLFYTHANALNGPRTYVLFGNQQHLTFVADLEGHVDPTALRSLMIERFGLYPHLIDLDPAPGLPRLFEDVSVSLFSSRSAAQPRGAGREKAADLPNSSPRQQKPRG